jgi:histidinol dehydrogenase
VHAAARGRYADPAVLYAARACGVDTVYKLGGVQAIAAMAFGTDQRSALRQALRAGQCLCHRRQAARLAAAGRGPAIDMPAGPSEVLVVADAIADAEFVAADLLSQAEHGHDSQALLVTPSVELVETVDEALQELLLHAAARRSRRPGAGAQPRHPGRHLVQAVEVSNAYAPEHLILNVADPRRLMLSVENAGSIFLGRYTPESLGDYTSGTNHVLPTYGHARTWSGLSVQSFQKLVTVQEASADGLKGIGPAAITLAKAEGLNGACAGGAVAPARDRLEGRP